jgi:hypothetical protein
MRAITLTIFFVSLIIFSFQVSAKPRSAHSRPAHSRPDHPRPDHPRPGKILKRVAQLEAQVEALAAALEEAQEILQFVRVEAGEIGLLSGPHWIIEGANVHVQSGSGNTHDSCGPHDPNFPNCERLTGLGNLIVGYNELAPRKGFPREVRTGSHNLVVGEYHSYSSFAGFVTGNQNWITGAGATVCGGADNEALGSFSSVSGGHGNLAIGDVSSVSGGEKRTAEDTFNWAAGSLVEPN